MGFWGFGVLGFKICAQIKGISGLEHKKSASN